MPNAGQNQTNPNPQPSQVPQNNQYINPNNYHQVLGAENVVLPAGVQQVTPEEVGAALKQGADKPVMPIKNEYQDLRKQASVKTSADSHDTIKLVIYAVPIIAVFFHLLKPIDDEEVKWHVKQSLVGQGIWFSVLIFLRIIDVLIISYAGATLWSLVCYGFLLIAGVKAYNHEKYQMPIVHDLGKNFIEEA